LLYLHRQDNSKNSTNSATRPSHRLIDIWSVGRRLAYDRKPRRFVFLALIKVYSEIEVGKVLVAVSRIGPVRH
jgi:hypothetical protein